MSHTQGLTVSFDDDLPSGFCRIRSPGKLQGKVIDGLSGPWFMRWMFRQYDQRTLEAAAYHDLGYREQAYSRGYYDKAFFKAILEGGQAWCQRSRWSLLRRLSWWTRCKAAYYILRVFGSFAWKRHQRAK